MFNIINKSSFVGKELSGEIFNAFYKGTYFYKFFNHNLNHNNFQYQLGLNIDIEEFCPNGLCYKGGLYFCEESKAHMYWSCYGTKIGVVEIPNDARVYIEQGKFKADRLIITEIVDFVDVCDKFWIKMLQNDATVLQFIKDQTEDMCISAVRRRGGLLKFVKNQTNEICKYAVCQNGLALIFVNEQTEELCKLAVHQTCEALNYVQKQFKTDEVRKLAVFCGEL